jgi:hypothetical protein
LLEGKGVKFPGFFLQNCNSCLVLRLFAVLGAFVTISY